MASATQYRNLGGGGIRVSGSIFKKFNLLDLLDHSQHCDPIKKYMVNALSNCILKIEHGICHSNCPEDQRLGEKFLVCLGPLLAASELSCVELRQIKEFERLVGNSFLTDPNPFGTFYEDWTEYKIQCERMICGGMTVNERLFALGLLDDFELCEKNRDWMRMEQILREAHVDSRDIDAIIGFT